jgi:hypothetical protein
VQYDRSWYVGVCWQPSDVGNGAADSASCDSTPGSDRDVPFYRVVVAVTWPDGKCTDNTCSYVTATLISSASTEPEFTDVRGAQPPRISPPRPPTNGVSDVVHLQVSAAGGVAPIRWSPTGLPPGLSMDINGLVTGTLTTAGKYTVTATVTDSARVADTVTFAWTVNAKLAVSPPTAQVGQRGVAITALPLTATGGVTPYAWSAIGLPAGLSLNATTGQITGTPTTVGTSTVTVTATDKSKAVATATFTWRVQ